MYLRVGGPLCFCHMQVVLLRRLRYTQAYRVVLDKQHHAAAFLFSWLIPSCNVFVLHKMGEYSCTCSVCFIFIMPCSLMVCMSNTIALCNTVCYIVLTIYPQPNHF